MRTAVFFTSLLYTSLPTMGQKGTLLPSSCATPSARAVFPVPGAPADGRLPGNAGSAQGLAPHARVVVTVSTGAALHTTAAESVSA